MERYSPFYRYSFVIAAVLILGFALLQILAPIWSAVEWAVVLGFLLYPLQVRLSRALHRRPGLAAGILTGLTPFVIVAPLSVLAVVFAAQVRDLVGYLKDNSLLSLPGLAARVARFPLMGRAVQWLQHNLPFTADQVQAWTTQAAHTVLAAAAAFGGTFVVGVAGTIIRFFVMLILLYFLLRDGRAMLAHVTHLIPMETERRAALVHNLASVLRAVVYGTTVTAILQGLLIGIAFAIIGLPSPVVFGALAAAAAFIPAAGTATVLVPAILYLLAVGRWGAATFLLVWSGLLMLGEQLVRPLLTSRHAQIPALAVFIGAIGGVAAFGFIGFILGPVLISLTVTLIRLAGEGIARESGGSRQEAEPRGPRP